MSDPIIIIPARYNSTRFPGKPLAKINDKSMIYHVWSKCTEVLPKNRVYVATDDERIEKECNNYEISVLLTSKNCMTGTDRIYEASKIIDAETYINVQGDEPLIRASDIEKVLSISLKNPDTIINAMCKIRVEEDFFNYNIPKVVSNSNNELVYISRAPIPANKQNMFINAMKQVCIYGFPKKSLNIYGEKKSKTKLENIEDIEILRFIELGCKVKMVEVSDSSVAVDTKNDF